jgi:hypothetical protein
MVKQAACSWFQFLTQGILAEKFKQSKIDPIPSFKAPLLYGGLY